MPELFGFQDDQLLYKDFNDWPKVLLVEDDPATRWLVRSALKGECILSTVTSVDNYMMLAKTVNKYVSFRPDIVFLDIDLSPCDGRDILGEIISIDPDAYIVMFSAHNTQDNIGRSFEIGAKGFISKPFKKDQLLDFVFNATQCNKIKGGQEDE